MAQLTNSSTFGTSFFGRTITASINEITNAIGEPQYIGSEHNDSDCEVCWDCITKEGDVFTIYDYQLGKFTTDQKVVFHIGAHSDSVSKTARKELEKLLK